MKIGVDPMVDCVFKAILGKRENENLLIHFLNAVLELEGLDRVRVARVLNPYNEKEFGDAKYTVVDVKAVDGRGRVFQLEVQRGNGKGLKQRMLYSWAQTYSRSLVKGEGYDDLGPVISIWLLRDPLFPKIPTVHLCFQVFDCEQMLPLNNNLAINVLQLKFLKKDDKMETEKARWLHLFREGGNLNPDKLPQAMDTPEMRQAVDVMLEFSKESRDQHLYWRRQQAEINHRSLILERDEAIAEKKAALALVKTEKEEAKKKEAAWLAEKARLLQLLGARDSNLNDDQ